MTRIFFDPISTLKKDELRTRACSTIQIVLRSWQQWYDFPFGVEALILVFIRHFKCIRGYKRFYRRTSLESSDYLKDDCLVIKGTVGVVKSRTEGPKKYLIRVSPSDMGKDFGELLESKTGADVSFEVDGEVFAAHKVILAARSPVFRAQLLGPMKEKNMECIRVEDIEAPVFKVLFL